MRSARHFYRAYGLEIASEVPLPALLEGGSGTDVAIRFAKLDHVPALRHGRFIALERTAEEIHLHYRETGVFRIANGNEIAMELIKPASDPFVRLLLIGPLLGFLLHQRGILVLHASSIVVRGAVVGFVGAQGAGKSTTAAAFHARGYPLFSDDLVPVVLDGRSPIAHSGFPHLKLWPEAVVSLGGEADGLPQLLPGWDKRWRSIDQGFQPGALPLKRLYVLADGDGPEVQQLGGSASAIELVRHSYVAPQLEPLGEAERIFEQSSRLVNHVPVRRLTRPPQLAALADVVRVVEDDLREGHLGTTM